MGLAAPTQPREGVPGLLVSTEVQIARAACLGNCKHPTARWSGPFFLGHGSSSHEDGDPATSLPTHRVNVEGTAVRSGDVPCSPEENVRKLAFSRENSTPLHGSGVCREALQSLCLPLQKSGQGHEEEVKSSLFHRWGKEFVQEVERRRSQAGEGRQDPASLGSPGKGVHGCTPRCLSGAELVFKKHLLIRANPWLNGALPEVTNIP